MRRFPPHVLLAVVFTMLFAGNAGAQTCLVVSPSGAGSHTGADWNNALTGLPSTLVRGTVYYLADGSYGQYHFSSASGTGWVEIRKAQSYDNCTSTGWNTATMGNSQAVFTQTTGGGTAIGLSADQIKLNGNGTYAAQGCGGGPASATDPSSASGPVNPSDCGIKINTACVSTTNNTCDNMITLASPGDNFTFLYVEIVGNGNPNSEQYPFNCHGLLDNSATRLIEHVFYHDAGANFLNQCGHRQVDHSYFWGNQRLPSTGNHGQYSYDGFMSPIVGITEFANVYRDIQGTAIWGIEDGPQVASDVYLYDNIIMSTYPKLSWVNLGVNNGTLWCGNGSTCSNMFYVNNTHVNVVGNLPAPHYQDTGTTTSNITVENNIWYGVLGAGLSINTSGTQDHNSFLNNASAACPSGTANVCSQTAPNPFTNMTGMNFTLASDNADWNNRVSLGAPYNTDAAEDAFTTDRGAYQFGSTTTQVNPPTGLSAVVN